MYRFMRNTKDKQFLAIFFGNIHKSDNITVKNIIIYMVPKKFASLFRTAPDRLPPEGAYDAGDRTSRTG